MKKNGKEMETRKRKESLGPQEIAVKVNIRRL